MSAPKILFGSSLFVAMMGLLVLSCQGPDQLYRNGPVGLTGAAGTIGITGAAGTIGSTGAAGTNGAGGSGGSTGRGGTTGSGGTTGVAGTTGRGGTTGSGGTTGVAGTTGRGGTTGTAGTNGAGGTTGVAGTNGAGGTTGVAGTNGTGGTTSAGGTTGAGGATGTGPCAGLCAGPTEFTAATYMSPMLGTGATCYETTANLQSGNCSNFVSPRTLTINGTAESCNTGNWPMPLPAKVMGGYCIQVSAGNQSYAQFVTF